MNSIYAELRDDRSGVVGEGVYLLRDRHVAYLMKGIRYYLACWL